MKGLQTLQAEPKVTELIMQRKYSKSIERKPRPRLPGFNYTGHYVYFITICCEGENEFFKNESAIENCIAVLQEMAIKHGVNVIAYCFMPDHLHFLLESGETTDMFKFIELFKQVTSFRHKQATGKRLWQESFYDEVLKEDEIPIEVAKYIISNPMRTGLIRDLNAYGYWGSFVYSRDELLK